MLRGGKCDSDGFFAFPESSIGGGPGKRTTARSGSNRSAGNGCNANGGYQGDVTFAGV